MVSAVHSLHYRLSITGLSSPSSIFSSFLFVGSLFFFFSLISLSLLSSFLFLSRVGDVVGGPTRTSSCIRGTLFSRDVSPSFRLGCCCLVGVERAAWINVVNRRRIPSRTRANLHLPDLNAPLLFRTLEFLNVYAICSPARPSMCRGEHIASRTDGCCFQQRAAPAPFRCISADRVGAGSMFAVDNRRQIPGNGRSRRRRSPTSRSTS